MRFLSIVTELTVRSRFAEILAGIEEEIRATEGVTWKEALLPANRFRFLIVITLQIGTSKPITLLASINNLTGVQLTGNTSLAYCEAHQHSISRV